MEKEKLFKKCREELVKGGREYAYVTQESDFMGNAPLIAAVKTIHIISEMDLFARSGSVDFCHHISKETDVNKNELNFNVLIDGLSSRTGKAFIQKGDEIFAFPDLDVSSDESVSMFIMYVKTEAFSLFVYFDSSISSKAWIECTKNEDISKYLKQITIKDNGGC